MTFAQSLIAQKIGAFHHGDDSLPTHLLSLSAHAGVGAGAAALMREDPLSGAVGAVVGELSGMGLQGLGVDTAALGVPLSQAATVLLAGAFNLDPIAASSAGGIAARENAFAVPAVAVVPATAALAFVPGLNAVLLGVASVTALAALYKAGYFDGLVDSTFEVLSDLWHVAHMDADLDLGPKVESLPLYERGPQMLWSPLPDPSGAQILSTPIVEPFRWQEGFEASPDLALRLPGFEGYTGPDMGVLTSQNPRQPWNVRPGKEWKANVYGKAQKTGTSGHSLESYRKTIEAFRGKFPEIGEVERVHLNEGLSRVTGLPIKPNTRPDVTI